RHQRDCNSWMHNTQRLTRGKARHHLLMHPADLADRDLEDGTTVRVTSRVGSVEVEVRASDDVMRGVVSLPHGYGHQRSGVHLSNATTLPGPSINDLTDPERVDMSGNAALNGVPVTVEPSTGARHTGENGQKVTGRRKPGQREPGSVGGVSA
ncbi:MAG: molybdopterin dinucleotide binding domain-containing protein, partial [Nocardioidaceae bacterium]